MCNTVGPRCLIRAEFLQVCSLYLSGNGYQRSSACGRPCDCQTCTNRPQVVQIEKIAHGKLVVLVAAPTMRAPMRTRERRGSQGGLPSQQNQVLESRGLYVIRIVNHRSTRRGVRAAIRPSFCDL